MNEKGLKKVLLTNAAFSTLSGLVLLVDAGMLSDLFGGAHPWIFRGIGIGLLLFAADLTVTSLRGRISRGKALYFSLGDFGWVASSAVLLTVAPLPAVAFAVVTGVALVVLGFGLAQVRCIRYGSTRSA